MLCAGSKFKQNRALMQQPDPCLDIPEDEDLVDIKPAPTKPPKVVSESRITLPVLLTLKKDRQG